MMKFWNHFLVALTFLLSLIGTFITRSGMIQSVHSFTQSGIGPWFMFYIVFVAVFVSALFWIRRRALRSESALDSYVSRESAFLLNNLSLLGACFAVLWGTMFPMLSEALRGVKITVGPPWFNQVNVPMGLILLALTGIGPLVAWRRASINNLRSMFLWPLILSILSAPLLALAGVTHGYALVSFTLSVFVITAIVQEFWRGIAARRRQYRENAWIAFVRLIDKNRRRYGGYVVHLGMVAIFVGITGTAFNTDREATLKQGQTVEVGRYTIRYQGRELGRDANHEWARVRFNAYRGTEYIADMVPAKNFYIASQQPTTEVAIRTSLREDLYLALAGVNEDGSVTFKVFVNPLVQWIWIGGGIFALGTFIVMWPDPLDRRYLVPKYA
jgi:cytochrome c-type biogenesis protein CcmF